MSWTKYYFSRHHLLNIMYYKNSVIQTSKILLQITLYILIQFANTNCMTIQNDNSNMLQTKSIRNRLNLLEDDNIFGTETPTDTKTYNSGNDMENNNNGDIFTKETDNENIFTEDSDIDDKKLNVNKIVSLLLDPNEVTPKMIEKLSQFKTFYLSNSNDKTLINLCTLSRNYINDVCLLIQSSNRSNGLYNPYIYQRCVKLLPLLDFYHCVNEKQNYDETAKENEFKRVPFHAWGGKRFRQVATEKVQSSKVPFNAWGGKRQMNYDDGDEYCKRSKSKFHSWGGKRTVRETANVL